MLKFSQIKLFSIHFQFMNGVRLFVDIFVIYANIC